MCEDLYLGTFAFLFQTLITFVNKHLNKLNLEVTELETQVGDSSRTQSFPSEGWDVRCILLREMNQMGIFPPADFRNVLGKDSVYSICDI